MPFPRRRLLLMLGGTLSLTVLALLLLVPLLVDVDSFREPLRARAEAALGRPVRLGTLSLSLLPRLALSANDLALEGTAAEGGGPLLKARRLEIGVRLRPLLQGRVEITRLIIHEPDLLLRRGQDGAWVLPLPAGDSTAPAADGQAPTAAPDISVALLALRQGTVRLREENDSRTLVDQLELELTDATLTRPLDFTAAARVFGGGDGPRSLSATGRLEWQVKENHLHITLAPTRVTSAETALTVEASLRDQGASPDLQLALRDARIAEQDVGALLALAGMSLPGPFTGGDVRGTATLTRKRGRTVVEPLQLQLLGGSLQGTATVIPQGAGLGFRFEGEVDGLDLGRLLASGLAIETLAGRASGAINLRGGGATVDAIIGSLTGDGRLDIYKGHIDGLDVLKSLSQASDVFGEETLSRLSEQLGRSGMDFEELTGAFTIRGGRLATPDIELKTQDLKLAGSGELQLASGQLDGRFVLTLSPAISASMRAEGSRAARVFWRQDQERVALPLKLSGPLAAPHAGIDWRAAAGSLLAGEAGVDPDADLGSTLLRLLSGDAAPEQSPAREDAPDAADPEQQSAPSGGTEAAPGDPAAAVSDVSWGGTFLAKDLKLKGWITGTGLRQARLEVVDAAGLVIHRQSSLPELEQLLQASPDPRAARRVEWSARVDGKYLLAATFPLRVNLKVTTADGRQVETMRVVQR